MGIELETIGIYANHTSPPWSAAGTFGRRSRVGALITAIGRKLELQVLPVTQKDATWMVCAAIAAALFLTGCNSGDNTDAQDTAVSRTDEARAQRRLKDLLRPEVIVQTSVGKFRVRLDREHAPLTVDNFLEYVDGGHYDGTAFHQVEEGYMVLGGGYTEDLVEKPARPAVRNEAHNGLKNRRGTIAMARQIDVIDSSTCQFFINLDDNPMLDHRDREAEDYGYCVFGQVVEGFDVVRRIGKVEVHDTQGFQNVPQKIVMIESIHRVR